MGVVMGSGLPRGVAILAISTSLLGSVLLLAGILLPVPVPPGALVGNVGPGGNLPYLPILGTVNHIIANMLIITGLILLMMGIGLWRGINFARILLLLFQVPLCMISVILLLINPLAGILGLILGITLVLYLTRPSVVSYFEG